MPRTREQRRSPRTFKSLAESSKLSSSDSKSERQPWEISRERSVSETHLAVFRTETNSPRGTPRSTGSPNPSRRLSTTLSGVRDNSLTSRLDDLINSIPDATIGDSLSESGAASQDGSVGSRGDVQPMCYAHLEKAISSSPSIAKAIMTVAEYTGKPKLGVDMANVIVANGQTHVNLRRLFRWVARKATDGPDKVELLFREENVFTTFLSHIVLLEGRLFLINTLRRCLKPVASKKTSFEVDPNKEPSESARKVNAKSLVATVRTIFESIMDGVTRLSANIRCALCMVHLAVGKRFGPEAAIQAVGGVFFLRFFCPNIVSPERYGIMRDVGSEERRKLILVSKFVQLIANDVHTTGQAWVDDILGTLRTKKFDKKLEKLWEGLMKGGKRALTYLDTMSKVDQYVNSSARRIMRFVVANQELVLENTLERSAIEWDLLPEEEKSAALKKEEQKQKKDKKNKGTAASRPISQLPVTVLEHAIAVAPRCEKRLCKPRHYRKVHAVGSSTNFASG